MTSGQTPHGVRKPLAAGMPARRAEPGEEADADGTSAIGLPDVLARNAPFIIPHPALAGVHHAVELGSGAGVYTTGGGPGVQAYAVSGSFTVSGQVRHPVLVSAMSRACAVFGKASGYFTTLLVDGRVVDPVNYVTPFTAGQAGSGAATAVIVLAPGTHDLKLWVQPFWDTTGTIEYVGYIAVVDLGTR